MNWKSKNFIIPAASIAVALILVGSFFYYFKISGVISAEEAGNRTIKYVNQA